MKKKILCVLVASLALPCVAQAAESGFLVGAGVNMLTAKPDEGFDIDNTMLELKAGYKVNSYFMVDARYGLSIDDESFSYTDASSTTKTDVSFSYYGIYGTGIIPIGESFNVYGSVGFVQTKMDVDYSGSYECGESQPCQGSASSSDDSSSVALAVGASYFITNNFAVNAEYGLIHMGEYSNSNTDVDFSGFTLSGSYFF